MKPLQPPSLDSRRLSYPDRREDRVFVRYPTRVKAYCQSLTGEGELLWSVQIEELSCQDVKIISRRCFEPGTILRIGLIQGRKTEWLTGRAICVSPTPEADWTIVCTFMKKLEDDELRAWLQQSR